MNLVSIAPYVFKIKLIRKEVCILLWSQRPGTDTQVAETQVTETQLQNFIHAFNNSHITLPKNMIDDMHSNKITGWGRF